MDSYEELWKQILPELEHSISSISYETYIKQLVPVDIVGNKLILITTSKLFSETVVGGKMNDVICSALSRTSSGITDFSVYVAKNRDDYIKQVGNSEENEVAKQGSPINPKFTFDNFVIGPTNELICAAAKAVAENPGDAYNPLFIYGGSGLGKTHILMAIANYVKLHNPTLNVLYSTCEQFTNQYIENISRGKGSPLDFKNKYRSVDVLLLDDVQFLANKQQTQVEFFNTFNELFMQNKQIVLTCDRPPKEIDVLEDRLRTRFEGGLLADVQPPDLETRIAILKKKAEEKKTIIDLKVLAYIAEMGDSDVRALEGKLTKVIFASKLHERHITIDLVNDALKESIGSVIEELRIEDIINCVCYFYNISKADIISKKKNKEFVEPRQICMYLITEMMSLPLVTVGSKMGGRDHATVIYARDKISEQMKTDKKLSVAINDIKNMILKK